MNRVKDETFDPLKALDEAAEFPETWRPEPGETLKGVVRRYSMVTLEEGGDTYIAAIQTAPDAIKSVFISSTVLKGEFARQKPKVGEVVSIKYLGKPAGKRYHKFSLVLPNRPDPGVVPDWNQMDPDQANYNESRPDEKAGPYATATIEGPQGGRRTVSVPLPSQQARGGAAVAERAPVETVPLGEDLEEDPFADQ